MREKDSVGRENKVAQLWRLLRIGIRLLETVKINVELRDFEQAESARQSIFGVGNFEQLVFQSNSS
jgi:hypothetical protein